MPRGIPRPHRIIVDVALPIERLRIARRPTLAPGCGRHCIMRRDRQRASTEHEQRGLDYTEHYEIGYGEFMASRTHRDLGGEA